jgi:mRNA-degrading endonuclease RelE of RelBE toxin-antitoxin system
VAYKVLIKPSTQMDLDSLPDTEVIKVLSKISNLGIEPRPFGVQKVSEESYYSYPCERSVKILQFFYL